MFRRLATPDRLFDRPWHKGHPFCRRTSRLRRAAMVFILLLLGTVIFGYIYLTDSQRVRAMAESYLSGLIGGRVEVGSATLSIFEGLRLDDVRVRVDAEGDATDSLLFSAQTFVIRYNPRSMISGRLEATQIVVQKPFVHLAEDLDNNTWNWHRLGINKQKKVRPKTTVPHAPPALPEILLRNARVEISEIHGGRHATLGSLTIDGQLSPAGDTPGRYAFDLQSRGVSDGVGPFASGTIATGTGEVSARLMNFEFGRDIRSILPAEVRGWWERHELAGRVNIPVLSYTPPHDGAKPKFRVETELNGVTLTIPPEEWLSSEDGQRLADTREAVSLLQNMRALAGYRVDDPSLRRSGWSEVEEIAAANQAMDVRILDTPGPMEGESPLVQLEPTAPPSSGPDRLAGMLRRFPVKLQSVAGRFVFTEDGIEVHDVGGRVENNGLKIRGRIFGYRPDATVALRISSFDSENLTIPAAPRYINSMPPQVRELYDQLRPQGTGRLSIDISRPEVGARPVVSGQLEIMDGSFVFDKFPYPLRKATGRILFGRDPQTGLDRVAIERLRGRGIEGGPNQDAIITIDGRIEPLGPTAGVNISVLGTNVSSEEALKQAFPKEVREALKIFDPENTGRYPTFHGGFVTHVVRPLGYRTPWSFDTDVMLDDAAGTLAAFPYPLKHVTGTLHVRNGYVDIVDAAATKGDASLTVNGRVAWGGPPITNVDGPNSGPAAPPEQNPFRLPDALRPKTTLKVAVRNMPIDKDLIGALPADRRAWLESAKLSGRVDVDGTVFEVPLAPGASIDPADTAPRVRPLDYEFAINVHNTTARPLMGDFEVTGVDGKLRLTSKQLKIVSLIGQRGGGAVNLSGAIEFADEGPLATFSIGAKGLPLDPALFAVLPKPAQDGWTEIEPSGKIDAEVTYHGRVDAIAGVAPKTDATMPAGTTPATTGPETRPAVATAEVLALKTTVHPQGVKVKLKSIPYPLEDLTGTMTVENGIVRLDNIRAKHGKGSIAVTGTGTMGGRPNWDLKLSAEGLPIDDELRAALPPALTTLIDSLKIKGTLGVDFSKLNYRYPLNPATIASADNTAVPTVSLSDPLNVPGPDIDLAATVMLSDASLDAGMPLTDVQGRLGIVGSVRDGRLSELTGGIDVGSMKLAGRDIKNFKCGMSKPADRTELRLEKMTGTMSGGELAGSVKVAFPDVGPSKYAAEMVLRGADVKQFAAADTDTNLKGSLTASLSLEGNWNDASARRGRGDVVVTGKEMYRVPLLLGLSQVTNLTLPISSPFNEATARYSLQGQQVAFDVIELKSSTMTMTGEGHLDFATKEVALTFVTDNPSGLKVPFINDILQGARHELLKINIRGTVQEPKVSAGVMSTFTTTVDEVFKGDPPAKAKKKK